MTELAGRAWISQVVDFEGRPGGFIGYWETDEEQPRVLEDGLSWPSVEPALSWARQRAAVVMVRLADTDYYSAGERQPSWQPDAPRRSGSSP